MSQRNRIALSLSWSSRMYTRSNLKRRGGATLALVLCLLWSACDSSLTPETSSIAPDEVLSEQWKAEQIELGRARAAMVRAMAAADPLSNQAALDAAAEAFANKLALDAWNRIEDHIESIPEGLADLPVDDPLVQAWAEDLTYTEAEMVAYANSSEGIALAQALLNVYPDFDQWASKTKEGFLEDMLVNAVTLAAPYGGGSDLETCMHDAKSFLQGSSVLAWMAGWGTFVSCATISAWATGGLSLGPCAASGFGVAAYGQAQAILTYSRDKGNCNRLYGGGGDDGDIHPEHPQRR